MRRELSTPFSPWIRLAACLATVGGSLSWCAESARQGPSPALPHGLFCTTNTCNWVVKDGHRVDLFRTPVDGVLNYVPWRNIETKRGVFRWPGLERMIREAKAADKCLAYHVLAGIHAPDWLFEQGRVPAFEYTVRGRKRRTYLPWTAENGRRVLNRRMLEIWREVVTALAARIRSDPEHRRFWYVAMTGWPEGNGLELMWAVDKAEDFQKLGWESGGRHFYIEFCRRIVDIFLDAFPDMPLGIAFTDYYGRTTNGVARREPGVSDAIVTYALEQGRKRGRTVIPMGLWLGNRYILEHPNHPLLRLMRKYRGIAPGIAFEGPMGSYAKTYAPLEEQLRFAVDFGTAWMQVWHHDAIHEPYRDLLLQYRKRFEATSK